MDIPGGWRYLGAMEPAIDPVWLILLWVGVCVGAQLTWRFLRDGG